MRWFRQKYRYATVRYSHAILHFFFFFFKDYICNLNLSRCRAVLMYDIVLFLSISVLKTWSQKQDSSLVYLERDGRGWTRKREGKGGVSCGIITIFIYIFTVFTYLQFYTVVDLSVAVLWLFILLFLLWFRYPPIYI